MVDARWLALFVNSLELTYTGTRFTSGEGIGSADLSIDPGRAGLPGDLSGSCKVAAKKLGVCA